jgi:1,4-alpha-glucan branching enzyme
MAIEKKVLKSKPVTKVTFSLNAPENNEVKLVGDFNGWNLEANPLKKQKNGTFKTTLDLSNDTQYEFKYVIDGAYTNDNEADGFVHNAFSGEQNSVIVL